MTSCSLTLYHSLTSVCSQKVRLTLAELNLGFDSRVMDLKKGDQFAPDYLKLNPNAVVPTLLDGSRVILQSNEIIQYLCAQHPHHPFSCASTDARGALPVWLDRAGRLHVAIHALTYVCVNREKLLALTPEQLEQRLQNMPDPVRSKRLREIVETGFDSGPVSAAIETINALLPPLQTATSDHKWLAGSRFTLADTAIFPFVHRLYLLGFSQIWGQGNLARWHADVMQRAGFETAISSVVPKSDIDTFKAAGKIAWPQLQARFR